MTRSRDDNRTSSDRSSGSIGLVLPFDSALDREYWRYLPDSLDLFIARTPHISGPLGVPLITAVSEADLVLPVVADMAGALDPDIVVYACTSGSFVRGLDACLQLRNAMEAAGCRRAGSTSEFLVHALSRVGARRVALGTPYDDDLTSLLVAFLDEAGFETVSVRNLGMTGDPKTVPPDTVLALATETDTASADVVLLSCTNLRTFDHVGVLERQLGKPVLTANQVTMWGAMERAGLPQPHLDQSLFR